MSKNKETEDVSSSSVAGFYGTPVANAWKEFDEDETRIKRTYQEMREIEDKEIDAESLSDEEIYDLFALGSKDLLVSTWQSLIVELGKRTNDYDLQEIEKPVVVYEDKVCGFREAVKTLCDLLYHYDEDEAYEQAVSITDRVEELISERVF